jgi:alkylated DNA repair dioxygenase AlkB
MIEHMFGQAAQQEVVGCHGVTWQGSLFGLEEPTIDAAFGGIERRPLDRDSWVDHLPRWLAGSDQVFAELVARVPWRRRVVHMYDRMLDEPRLTWWWSDGDDEAAIPLPVLKDAAAALSRRYRRTFDSVGLNLYRDGRDSVAWHGDRIRHAQESPLVAIISVGSPRPFLLRPRGGGPSHPFLLGQGDLLVMGGDCQHDWEHTVPKVAVAGPRISITFRHGAPAPAALDHPSRRGAPAMDGRAGSSQSRNGDGANGWHHARGVRVREHPAETEAS